MSAEPKPEPLPERSSSSQDSTPDAEAEVDGQDPPQAQRRKGGRKPIYATSEERKQRNRQAQAAFRERRTEYIKQLEITIKHNEDALQTLQHNHRAAADECLMLRYKNSLLERILLEKGIDVQAELQSKGEDSVIRPMHPAPQVPANLQSVARGGLNRPGPFGRRQPPGLAPKLDMTTKSFSPQNEVHASASRAQATSPRFPTPTSPYGNTPAGAGRNNSQFRQQYSSFQSQTSSPHSSAMSPTSQQFRFPPGSRGQELQYSQMSPASNASFRGGRHEHSYSGLGDLEDEAASRTSDEHFMNRHEIVFQGSSQRPPMLPGDAPFGMTPTGSQGDRPVNHMATGADDPHTLYESTEHLMDHDHGLDADPFGLSASMHFPTQF